MLLQELKAEIKKRQSQVDCLKETWRGKACANKWISVDGICMAPFSARGHHTMRWTVLHFSHWLGPRSMLCAGRVSNFFCRRSREGKATRTSEHELMTSARVKGFQNNKHRLFASFAVLMIISHFHSHSDFKDQFHGPPRILLLVIILLMEEILHRRWHIWQYGVPSTPAPPVQCCVLILVRRCRVSVIQLLCLCDNFFLPMLNGEHEGQDSKPSAKSCLLVFLA